MPEKSPKGHLRGNPLDIPIKEEANHRSVFGTGVSNGRCVCPAHPLLRLWKLVTAFASECLVWVWDLPPHNFAHLRERKRQTNLAMYGGEGRQAKSDKKDLGGRKNYRKTSPSDDPHEPAPKTGSPKPTRFRWRFGYFFAKEKVPRRRPTPAIAQMVLPCRIAARRNLG